MSALARTLLIILASLSASCVSVVEGFLPDKRSPSGRNVLPALEASWFHKDKVDATTSHRFDPDSLYVYRNPPSQPPGEKWLFMRFWPNGRFALSNGARDRPPTATDGDDLRHCFVGHYRIKGDELKTEAYAGHSDSQMDRWQIRGDSIIRFFNGRPSPMVYERVQFPHGSMKVQPDW